MLKCGRGRTEERSLEFQHADRLIDRSGDADRVHGKIFKSPGGYRIEGCRRTPVYAPHTLADNELPYDSGLQ